MDSFYKLLKKFSSNVVFYFFIICHHIYDSTYYNLHEYKNPKKQNVLHLLIQSHLIHLLQMKQNFITKIVSLFTTLSPKQYMLGFYHSTLLNERNIEYYPYPKYWVYDNIYLNLLTLEHMKGSVITRYEKAIETID